MNCSPTGFPSNRQIHIQAWAQTNWQKFHPIFFLLHLLPEMTGQCLSNFCFLPSEYLTNLSENFQFSYRQKLVDFLSIFIQAISIIR
jgi:hypothetical protein